MRKTATSLRSLNFKKSFLPHAEGSCLVSMGNTQVLCVATVEDSLPDHAKEKGHGWVHAEYAMLPRSGLKRTSRSRASSGGRSQEISRLIGRSLRAAVDLDSLGPRSITIDCDVLRADGGTRTASINGGFVALAQALLNLHKKRELIAWPLKDFVGAVSVGLINGRPTLDICYEEDKDAQADVNIVMTGQGKLIEIQGTAEGEPFSSVQLNQMMRLAQRGIQTIVQSQKRVLGALPSR